MIVERNTNCIIARELGKGLTLLADNEIISIDMDSEELGEITVTLSHKLSESVFQKLAKLGWLCVSDIDDSRESFIYPLL